MSIDRRELHRVLNYPDDLPIFDVPARARHFAQGVVPEPLPFDPERAAQLFASAGWVDTDNDNILDKDGQEFRFTLSTAPNESAEAVYLQDQFRRVGIRAEISTYDRSVLRQRTQAHDFDAAIVRSHWIPHLIQEGEREAPSGTGHENAELSRLVDAYRNTIDQQEADKHMRGLWDIIGAEIPVTYLHNGVRFRAAHRRVRGIQNNRAMIVEHLWIEEEGREPMEP